MVNCCQLEQYAKTRLPVAVAMRLATIINALMRSVVQPRRRKNRMVAGSTNARMASLNTDTSGTSFPLSAIVQLSLFDVYWTMWANVPWSRTLMKKIRNVSSSSSGRVRSWGKDVSNRRRSLHRGPRRFGHMAEVSMSSSSDCSSSLLCLGSPWSPSFGLGSVSGINRITGSDNTKIGMPIFRGIYRPMTSRKEPPSASTRSMTNMTRVMITNTLALVMLHSQPSLCEKKKLSPDTSKGEVDVSPTYHLSPLHPQSLRIKSHQASVVLHLSGIQEQKSIESWDHGRSCKNSLVIDQLMGLSNGT